jgi:MFS family permease
MDRRTRWLALIVLCLGDLMIVLDTTIVNVALPSIREDLGFTETSLAWVVNAYLLTFGGFLLLGGRLGDLFGHRRLFLIGISLFTAGLDRLRPLDHARGCSSERGPSRGSAARSSRRSPSR